MIVPSLIFITQRLSQFNHPMTPWAAAQAIVHDEQLMMQKAHRNGNEGRTWVPAAKN
jgi:hypothetical protein